MTERARGSVRSIGRAALAAGVLFGCAAPELELEASLAVYLSDMQGDVSLESSAGGGLNEIDFESDLDLDEDRAVPYGRGRFSVGDLHATVSAFQTRQTGNGLLSASFGDINVGAAVDSEFELVAAQGALTYDLIDVGVLRVAPGVAVDYFDVDLEVVEPLSGLRETLEASQPLPLLFLEAEVDPPVLPVDLLVRVGGIAGSYGDFEGTILDGEALLRWQVLDPVEVYGGYRVLFFELDGVTAGQAFESDFRLDGWVLGAGVRF